MDQRRRLFYALQEIFCWTALPGGRVAGAVVRYELRYNKCLAVRVGEAERSVTNGTVASRSISRTVGSMQTRSPQSSASISVCERARMLAPHFNRLRRQGGRPPTVFVSLSIHQLPPLNTNIWALEMEFIHHGSTFPEL